MTVKKVPETKRKLQISHHAVQVLAIIIQSAISATEAIAGETTVKMNHVSRLRASMLFEQAGYEEVDKWTTKRRNAENKLSMLVSKVNKSEGAEYTAAFNEIGSATAAVELVEQEGRQKRDRHVDMALLAWTQKQITKSDAPLTSDALFAYGELCTAFNIPPPTDEADKKAEAVASE